MEAHEEGYKGDRLHLEADVCKGHRVKLFGVL